MSFAVLALGFFTAFAVLDAGVRAWVQRRRTGDTGVRRPRGLLQWWARGTFALGVMLAGVGAPIADLAGLPTVPKLDGWPLRMTGASVAAIAILAVFTAQLAMGTSWRTTIDPSERPALVTTWPFSVTRNPIYTAVCAMAIGLALTVPNLVALVGVAAVVVGCQAQVRLIEEPYLRRVHGDEFVGYTRRVGRFLPHVGRHRSARSSR